MGNGKITDAEQVSWCTWWGTGLVFSLQGTAAVSLWVHCKISLTWETDMGTANCHSRLWLNWAGLMRITCRRSCLPILNIFLLYKRWKKIKFLKSLLQMVFKAFLTNVSKVNTSQQSKFSAEYFLLRWWHSKAAKCRLSVKVIYVQCKKGHADIWPFMSHIEETAGFVCGGISTELLFCFTLWLCFRVLQSLNKVHAFEISTC